jgi:hypothetical protein
MAINVAGTNALGDYLVSEIVNTRTLMGLAPQANSLPAASASATAGSTPGTPGAPTRTDMQAQVLAQETANAQTLFGVPSTSQGGSDPLPPIAGQTPLQIANVAIQSSNLESEFANIATLFGSLGLGANTDTNA